MNVGFIFTTMLFTLIIGTEFYEMLIVYLHFDYYITNIVNLFLQALFLFLVYYINSFLSRMIFLSLFNGLFGFYNILNFIIKSNILIGRYRSTIMRLFRIPISIYMIVIFLHLHYMNCFTLALISSIMCLIAFIIGMFLMIYLKMSKKKEENQDYNVLLPNDI